MTAERDAELLRLHERLVAGDPAAPSELAERLLPLLIDKLRWLESRAGDPQSVLSAVDEVVASYLSDPGHYQPERGGLVAYLAMEARGDVLNELDSLRRRRARERPDGDSVELHRAARDHNAPDNPVEEEVLDRVDPLDASPEEVHAAEEALAGLDEVDRRMLLMMVDGVRSTVAYAAVLGISHLPVGQQRKLVKRHKDRLHKRLERIRARLT